MPLMRAKASEKPVTANDPPTDPELIRFLREELGEEPVAGGGKWTFTGPVWLWRGKAQDSTPASTAWHFITIDGDTAEAIRKAAPGRTAAWGSVYVQVMVGKSAWRTSLFPSKEVKGYLLPVKASIRKAEHLNEGSVVTVHLAV